MKTILIVDDEPNILELVCATLAGDPRYIIKLARDGVEALEIARTDRPDLVFLDIAMPKMDGYQVCRALKSDPATAQATVVMLTARAGFSDRTLGAKAGADDYFTKPFRPASLLDKVELVLMRDEEVETSKRSEW